MCEPATVALAFGALSAAGTVYSALNKPKAPEIQAPTPAPQAAKMPDATAVRNKIISAVGAGDPTALTAAGGVSNNQLTLGKSTVLGA